MLQKKIPLWFGLPIFILGTMVASWLPLNPRFQKPQSNADSAAYLSLDELNSSLEAKNKNLTKQLTELARVDLADYLRLQKEEEQFKKSRELLGKVFLVLFENLLSNIPQDQMDFARASVKDASSDAADQKTANIKSESGPGLVPASRAGAAGVQVNSDPQQGPVWYSHEKDLASVQADKPEQFLASAVIKDMGTEIKGYKKFKSNDSRLNGLQGFFAGDLIFEDKRRKPWRIEMTLNSEIAEGVPKGSMNLRIIQEDNNVSNGTGSGDLRGIQQTASESKALIIHEGDKNFLQMYLLETQDSVIGNYYEQTDSGETKLLGHFTLRR